MVFETKKVQLETLGEYLKAVRTAFNLSTKEAADRSSVNLKLLIDLESGKMQNLPADVYVIGALKELAKLYQVSEKVLVDQFKKERQISLNAYNISNPTILKFTNYWKNFVLTPKLLFFLLAGFFIIATFSYLFWQVSSINRTPKIEIFSPKDQEIVQSLSVNVSGKTDPDIIVQINGQEIFVDSDGKFNADVSLSPGPQEINILAQNRFGKRENKILKVFSQVNNLNSENSKIVLKLVFLGDVSIEYSVDQQTSKVKEFKAEDVFEIQANEKIILSAQDGGLVRGELNGQVLGILGKKGEVLRELTFSN